MKPQQIIDEVSRSGRSFLLEPEAYQLCDCFDIPHPASVLLPPDADPDKAAAGLSYPVVAKIVSPVILHKSDVGGVLPGIGSAEELPGAVARLLANVKKNAPDAQIKGILLQQMAAKGGVEVVIGGLRNNAFGPVVMFGLGGVLVEVFKDVSFRLALLDEDEALRMIMETRATRTRIAPLPLDIVMAVIIVVVVLDISRRTVGNIIVGIALFMILYCLFGYLIPSWVGCPKFTFGQVICYFYGYEGIFGIPMQTSATYILLFVVFSAFLNLSGAAKAFIDLSLAACNKMLGGAAKLTILVNTLMGMVSGTPIANVVTTGPFCIPLMQKSGMRGVDASAMTAAAAVGSQIIPPVMGAAAFIMVEYIGVSYLNLIWIALIPALLYMFSLIIAANCMAHRFGMKPVDMTDVPSPKQIFKEQWNVLLSPLVLLFMIIVVGSSLSKAVVYAMLVCIVMSWFNKKKEYRLGIKAILKGMEDGVKDILSIVSICGAAGIVIGALSLSGFGLKFSMMLVSLSGGVVFFALLLCCVLVILLGMGLPPSAVYLIPAIMVAPALVNMGVNKIAAHMFIFYFSCFAPLTPPVAMAAYTAAPFSNSNPNQVGFASAKIALAGFVIPFVFALQPCMLFQEGTILEGVVAVVAATVGTYAFASGINGWYFGRTNVPIAAGLIVGGLLLIWPGLVTDLTGVAIIAALFFVQKARHRGGRGDEIEAASETPAAEEER